MCIRAFNIKSSALYGTRKAFVPCGKCEECRQSLKNQWAFRLRTELLYCQKNKWNVGFFTLTYNDENLPLLPSELLKPVSGFEPSLLRVPCFSRYDCRTFIDNIRKRLNERYGLGGNRKIRYLLACEYGSHTKRPHMHGLICMPPEVPPNEVYELIKRYWNKGFVFPRKFTGGVDSSGYKHKPFLLSGDVSGAAVYASKYCCKDLDFYESIKGLNLDFSQKSVKDCMPFHIQSKSIGLQFFQNKDARELLDCLKNGESFIGSTKRLPLPVYIRNKILYRPDYVFKPCPNGDWWFDFECDKWRFKRGQGTHKRLVRREALDFFKENVNTVLAQKVDYYKSLFEDMNTKDFWLSKQVPKDKALQFVSIANSMRENFGFDAERLALAYVVYYGVPYEKCKAVPPEKFYLARYDKSLKWHKRLSCINETYYKHMDLYLSFLLDALKFAVTVDLDKRKRLAKIIDRYKSLT